MERIEGLITTRIVLFAVFEGVLVLVASLLCLSLPVYWYFIPSSLVTCPWSGELRTQKLKSHHVKTQSLNVLPLKPIVGQYIAMHATLTARDFSLLISTFRSIHLHFFQNLSRYFPVLAVANTGSCVGPQNKIGHPAGYRFLVECPRNMNRLKKT